MADFLTGRYEHNQAMQCAQHLVNVHGYDHLINERFCRVVDDQHALLININSADFLTRGDTRGELSLSFALARRDINEFRLERDPERDSAGTGWLMGTLTGGTFDTRFFTAQQRPSWYAEVGFAECLSTVDALAEEFPAWADLDRIEAELYDRDPPVRVYAWSALANSALSGDDRADPPWEQFMTLQVRDREPLRTRAQTYFDKTQEFRSAHPNGVR